MVLVYGAIQPLFCHERQAKHVWTHIARTTRQDPRPRQMSFQPMSVNRIRKKRHGRPRQNWVHYTKNMFTKKHCNSLTLKRPFKRMHAYSMQPVPDTFKKNAGTLGYANAFLPLLTCRGSRVEQKRVIVCCVGVWALILNRRHFSTVIVLLCHTHIHRALAFDGILVHFALRNAHYPHRRHVANFTVNGTFLCTFCTVRRSQTSSWLRMQGKDTSLAPSHLKLFSNVGTI